MAALFAWPSELKLDSVGLALTFVVPASSCGLKCGFCAIERRREITESRLSVTDYTYFLEEIARHEPLAIAAIQGYEPLQEDSWPYTTAILGAARQHGVPRSLVTNGIFLTERARGILELEPTGVTISIDSAISIQHDKVRGVVGAFDKTLEGIRALSSNREFAGRITISSVLLPRRRRLLDGMPRLLSELGISHWVVSPLLRIGRNSVGGPVGETRQITEDLVFLHDLARVYGVSVVLDDELGMLPEGDYAGLVIRRFERPDGLLRLTPSGACSIGKDILKEVGAETPIWRPSELAPHEFVRSILSPAMLSRVLLRAA